MHHRVRNAGIREEPQLARAQPLPDRDEDLACADVLPARTDMPPLLDRVEHADQVIVAGLGVLDRHDRVGAGRDRRAGCDRDRLAHPDRRLRPLPDHGVADHLELGRIVRRRFGDVGRAEREAVHRRRRELRKIHGREDVLRGDAPVGVGQRQLQRSEGLDPREDPLARFLERDQALRRVVILRVLLCHAAQSTQALGRDDAACQGWVRRASRAARTRRATCGTRARGRPARRRARRSP